MGSIPMSETDIEIAWRATVEDARAYLRGEISCPHDGTLAGDIHQRRILDAVITVSACAIVVALFILVVAIGS